MDIIDDIKQEVLACQGVGMFSKAKAARLIAYAEAHEADMESYDEGGMNATEIVDLLVHLIAI